MADGEFYEPADHAGTDIPNRFDISGYRNGLFGGPEPICSVNRVW